jgi:hypothetical protein
MQRAQADLNGGHFMPRISADERAAPIIPGERPLPPEYFGDEESKIWNEFTDGLSDERIADVGFQILAPLLASHLWHAREISKQIAALMEAGAWGNPTRCRILRQLLRDQGVETTQIIALSRSLRLTAQSKRYDSAEMATAPVSRPWEDWDH